MAVKSNRQINIIIKRYTKLLLDAGYPIDKIILFGSYAKRKAKTDSDIDLAIILKEFAEDRFTVRLKLMKYCRGFDEVIEPHPFWVKEFNKQNPFASEIIENGVVVYS